MDEFIGFLFGALVALIINLLIKLKNENNE